MPEDQRDNQTEDADKYQPEQVIPDKAGSSVADAVAQEEGTPGTRQQQQLVKRLEPFFDGANLLLYGFVGVMLIGVALAALGYALFTIPKNLSEGGVPTTLTKLLSELLLVLILVEIIRTIMTFITTRTSSIRPFLTVAIISSVRRILSVGAELSLEDLKGEEFNRAIAELGVEGGLILIVALALFLVSRREGG